MEPCVSDRALFEDIIARTELYGLDAISPAEFKFYLAYLERLKNDKN